MIAGGCLLCTMRIKRRCAQPPFCADLLTQWRLIPVPALPRTFLSTLLMVQETSEQPDSAYRTSCCLSVRRRMVEAMAEGRLMGR